MRILGFSKKWGKLNQPEFTTFRFERRDKDWQVGEQVKIVFQPRRKGGGEYLGIAEIIDKQLKLDGRLETNVTDAEAIADGFANMNEMEQWMIKAHGFSKVWGEGHMNKLTLRWLTP